MGYYGLFLGLKYKNTLEIDKRLDAENYQDFETVTIKVPLTVPYFYDTEFERIDGEIEHNGEFYHLVKQKLVKDTLHIVCFKDVKSKQIKQALVDYVRTFTDNPGDATNSKTITSFIKDYITTDFKLGSSAEGWNLTFAFRNVEDFVTLLSLSILSPPPEM